MGHRRVAGYLRDQVIGGTAFLRLDVPSVVDGETVSPEVKVRPRPRKDLEIA